jgi:uncharacterized coiled-coil protein SlyX
MQDNETNKNFSDEPEIIAPDEEEALSPIQDVVASQDTVISEDGEPVDALEGENVETEEEGRGRRAFRKFIRWTVGLLIVFGLGFLAAIFTIYNQKVAELDQSKGDLSSAGTTIDELEDQISTQQDQIDVLNAQIDSLAQEITDLESQNQDLLSERDGFNLQIAILKARADVVSAQVELFDENPAKARVLLESVSQTLDTIESLLPEDVQDVVAPLKSRLELVVGGIETDPETAIADLGILAADLLEIENALFSD